MRPGLLLLLALVAPALAAQPLRSERGSRTAERKSVLAGNRVGITVFNYGLLGGVGELRGNWPLGSNDFYLGDLMPIVGAEVTTASGARVPIIAVPRGPGNRGIPVDPTDPSLPWTLEAVPGYAAAPSGSPFPSSESFASSADPSTWPATWPDRAGDPDDPGWAGAWDGLLGKNRFVNGVELYSHLADNNVRGVDYTPDPADPTRGGAGLVVRQRVVALRDAGFEDAVLLVWDVANASPRDLDPVAVGFVAGTLAGGDGDSQDDLLGYDASRRLVYSYDFDNRGNQGQPVGITGFLILPTAPGAPALASALGFAPANTFPLRDRQQVWNTMQSGTITLPDWRPNGGADGDLFMASSPFGLAAFSEQRVVMAVLFGETLADVQRGADALLALAAGNLAFDPARVTVTAPGDITTVFADVTWTSPDPAARVRLDVTADGGRSWRLLADGQPASGTFVFNGLDAGSGVYRVRATALTDGGAGWSETGTIVVPGLAPPVATVRVPPGLQQGTVTVTYRADSPSGSVSSVRLLDEALGGTTTLVASTLPAAGTVAWDTRLASNGLHRLLLQVTDALGTSESATDPVLVDNPRAGLAPGALSAYTGVGDGAVEVREALPEAVTGHTYRVDFAGGFERAETYTVTDETTGATILTAIPIPEMPLEGPLADGLRLVIQNPETGIRFDSTGWTQPDGQIAPSVNVPNVTSWRLTGRALPSDYTIAFSDALVTESLGGFRVGSGPLAPTAVSQMTNVTVTNTRYNRPAPFVFLDRDNSGSGVFGWTPGAQNTDNVIVYDCPRPVTTCTTAELVPTLFFRGSPTLVDGVYVLPGRLPTGGDVLSVVTRKAIQDGDAYRFQALFVVDGEDGPAARGVTLAPPFPNPARGQATLRVGLAAPGAVRLRVFDVLGREVATVADGEWAAGTHTVPLDTSRLAPGLYVVRLDGAGAVATQRLVVVR